MSLDGSQLHEHTSASLESDRSDAVCSLNSTPATPMSNTGTKSKIVPKFRAFSFRLTFRAVSSNAIDKGALLKEHVSNRMALQRPLYVTSQIAFYDDSQLSGEPDIDGFLPIELQGYVQTNNGARVPAMKKWIEDADWTAISGGLASDKDFNINMQKSEDANNAWTRLIIFGSVGMNNHGREAQKNARKVG